jgi:hypothetical protein
MVAVCLTCGRVASVQDHHPAGRRNDEHNIVPVCIDCHEILTSWQYAAGIALTENAQRSQLDGDRAFVVGVTHLVCLAFARVPDAATTRLWTLAVRAASRMADAAGDPDRVGRWLPDSTVTPRSVAPVEPSSDPRDVEDRRRQWVFLLVHVLRRLGPVGPLTAELAETIASQRRPLYVAIDGLASEDWYAPALAALIDDHSIALDELIAALCEADAWDRVDELQLDEVRVWVGTARRLLVKIVAALVPNADDPLDFS